MAKTRDGLLGQLNMDITSRMTYGHVVEIENKQLASVKITEYPDTGIANPEPISESNTENFEDFLSPQFLKNLTGESNLSNVTTLELQVDTSETSIGNIGQLVPNVTELKLSNSIINSIRDLGTCLNELKTLWLSRCSLIDLDGISCFYALKELYLSYNEIDDVSSVSMLDSLEVLDLEGNNIDDIAQVEFLALCTRLKSLTLAGNPVEMSPHPDTKEQDLKFYDYRSAIAKSVPQLEILDDQAFLFDIINGKRVIRSTSIGNNGGDAQFKEDLLLVQEFIKALPPIDEDDVEPQEIYYADRPASSASRIRPSSGRNTVGGRRPGSGNTRPGSSRNRPLSSRNRPLSSRNRNQQTHQERPQTSLQGHESALSNSSRAVESPDDLDQDDSSDLTHGSNMVLCGNPVRALLARKKELKGSIRLKLGRESPEQNFDRFVPEHSYHDDQDGDFDRLDVFEDLKRWRENFQRDSSKMFAKSEALDSLNRSPSLSPTPPPGNPKDMHSLKRRRMKNTSKDPSRPQTACDFRPSLSSSPLTAKTDPQEILSRSLDIGTINNGELPERGSSNDMETSAIKNIGRPSSADQKFDVQVHSEKTQESVVAARPRQFRPNTAAAAAKRTVKKPFS